MTLYTAHHHHIRIGKLLTPLKSMLKSNFLKGIFNSRHWNLKIAEFHIFMQVLRASSLLNYCFIWVTDTFNLQNISMRNFIESHMLEIM